MEEGYEVESILLKRLNNRGKAEYLVKWVGYPTAQATWEPLQNLENVLDLVEDFEQQDREEVVTSQRTKTRRIKRPKREIKRQQPNQARTQGSRRPNTRGRPRRQEPETIQLVESDDDRNEEPGQDQLAIDLDGRDGEDQEFTSEVEGEEVENDAPDENGEESQAAAVSNRSVSSSDAQPEGEEKPIEVLEVREFDDDIYFMVRFRSKMKMVARRYMRKYFPLELIEFYEKHITL